MNAASLRRFLKSGVLIMTYVAPVSSAFIQGVEAADVEQNIEKEHSFRYLLAFAAVGLFFSVSFALTPTALLPEGTVALAPDIQTVTGLTVSEIDIPAGLRLAAYPAH